MAKTRIRFPGAVLALALAVALLFACQPAIAAESCGAGLTWKLDSAGTLTVSGSGKMTNSPWNSSSAKIKKAVIGEGVLNICDYAFISCANLEEVSLPKSVSEFGYCAFAYCPKLTSVTVPEGVKIIGDYAFYSGGLAQVTLSEGLEEIKYCAFYDCPSLKNVTVPRSLKTVGEFAFGNETVLYAEIGSDGARALGQVDRSFRETGGNYEYKYRFENGNAAALVLMSPVNRNLETAADISAKVTEIGYGAFKDCTRLKSASLPSGVVKIGSSAFEGCKKLESLPLPSGLKSIEYGAFSDCSRLASLTIPDSLEDLNYSCFPEGMILYAKIGSTGAKTLGRYNYSFRKTGSDAFLLQYIYNGDKLQGLSLKKILEPKSTVKVPDGVTTLAYDYASGPLYDCGSKVNCLELPDSVSSLRMACFAGATRTFYIKCSKGSYAESFAKKHGLQYIAGSTRVIGSDITGVDAKVNWILSHYITSGMSDYQKVRTINDWLMCNAHYDYSFSSYGAEGVLIKGSGVCESYARAAQKLLTKAGIENMYVLGAASGESHAWNLVKVNGSWYHLDVTWNDPSETWDKAAISGFEYYGYFLLTSSQIKKDHSWTMNLPPTGPPLDGETDDDRSDLSEAKVSKIKDQVFTGKAIKPKLTVKYGKTKLKSGEDYTLSYKSNKAVGTATVTITGKGSYKGTKKVTFRIVPAQVQLKALKAGKKQLTVSWEKGKKIDGYEIEYSLKKNFKKSEKITVSKASSDKKTIKKLKSGKKYYVRIRAWKKVKGEKYYSAWSDVLSKKTK